MKKLFAIAAIVTALTGCVTTPVVETTKQWENHYMTFESFTNGTKNIVLEKNESIWVLSNSTLSRLLNNVKSTSESATK